MKWSPGQPASPEFLKVGQRFASPDEIFGVTAAPDNASFYTGSAKNAVHVWKIAAPLPTRNFGHPNHVDAVAFQPNGTLLASGCHDGRDSHLRRCQGGSNPRNHCPSHRQCHDDLHHRLHARRQTACLGQLRSNAQALGCRLRQAVREFKAHKPKDFEKGHQDGIFSAAISPDGKLLASGSGGLERVIKIWNLADGSVIRDLANPNIKGNPPASHPGWVYSLAFTHDGKYLVSAGDAPVNKGFVAVWDPRSGEDALRRNAAAGQLF